MVALAVILHKMGNVKGDMGLKYTAQADESGPLAIVINKYKSPWLTDDSFTPYKILFFSRMEGSP